MKKMILSIAIALTIVGSAVGISYVATQGAPVAQAACGGAC